MSCEPCVGWGCCIRVVRGGAAARGAQGCVVAQPLATSVLPAALLHTRTVPWGTAVWAAASLAVLDHPGVRDHPAAWAAPSPSHISTARAEPHSQRWSPPHGLAQGKLLSPHS